MDQILIKELEIWAQLGVPEAERARAQRLVVNVELIPLVSFADLSDDLNRTINYDDVARRIADIAADHPRRLIETLSSDIAATLLREFPASGVTVEVRKFVLADTRYVAVRTSVSRSG